MPFFLSPFLQQSTEWPYYEEDFMHDEDGPDPNSDSDFEFEDYGGGKRKGGGGRGSSGGRGSEGGAGGSQSKKGGKSKGVSFSTWTLLR